MKKLNLALQTAFAATLIGGYATAAIVDIKFDAQGRFAHEVEMAVGKTIEVCGPLKAGVAVDWSFKNAAPLNFNIHYHKGEAVVTPVAQKGAVNLAQKFTPETAQEYCWMWTNRNLEAVKLNVELVTTADAAKPAIADVAKPATAAADMTAGEVKKIDKENKKITIKHGEIKNLEMPAMTMVFRVNDAAMIDKLQAGDKVKFKVEKNGSAYVVTDIALDK